MGNACCSKDNQPGQDSNMQTGFQHGNVDGVQAGQAPSIAAGYSQQYGSAPPLQAQGSNFFNGQSWDDLESAQAAAEAYNVRKQEQFLTNVPSAHMPFVQQQFDSSGIAYNYNPNSAVTPQVQPLQPSAQEPETFDLNGGGVARSADKKSSRTAKSSSSSKKRSSSRKSKKSKKSKKSRK